MEVLAWVSFPLVDKREKLAHAIASCHFMTEADWLLSDLHTSQARWWNFIYKSSAGKGKTSCFPCPLVILERTAYCLLMEVNVSLSEITALHTRNTAYFVTMNKAVPLSVSRVTWNLLNVYHTVAAVLFDNSFPVFQVLPSSTPWGVLFLMMLQACILGFSRKLTIEINNILVSYTVLLNKIK